MAADMIKRDTSEIYLHPSRGLLIYVCLLVWHSTISLVTCSSKRTIYTLFTEAKSWNEAKALCESQFGQLFKAESQSDLDEVLYLDVYQWNYTLSGMLTSEKVWNGLHKPFANSTLEYQDCEVQSPDIALTATDPGGECGAFQSPNLDLVLTNCESDHPFICERYEGDCWFEPFTDLKPSMFDTWDILPVGTGASGCAYECRGRNSSNNECWGFQYDPNQAMYGCVLYYMSESSAQTNGGTSASVLYVIPSNMVAMSDTVLYVRRCFEGVLDSEVYGQFVNIDSSPDTVCSYHIYPGDAGDAEICYCPSNEQPPIPEPISDEAKAEEYVKELTIETSNTSAAQRKLISAEDNRTSAVSIGYLGVALLVTVFGGLFLLDLNTIVAELKKLFTNPDPSAETPESTRQESLDMPESHLHSEC